MADLIVSEKEFGRKLSISAITISTPPPPSGEVIHFVEEFDENPKKKPIEVESYGSDNSFGEEKITEEVETGENLEKRDPYFSKIIWIDELLLFCGISVAAIFGAFIRIGISYYNIWRIETNYCVMYAQIIGCVLMGFLIKNKESFFMGHYRYFRLRRLMYTILTSGLCGSITTFSNWQMECNKNMFIVADFSWGNLMGTYNGGRFLEWSVCLWIGVALPLMALHLGYFVAELLQGTCTGPTNESVNTIENNTSVVSCSCTLQEILVFVVFLLTSSLTILLPTLVFPTWIHITYTAVLGIAGAYLRYRLSIALNGACKSFPVGTFASNMIGSWVLAGVTVISKFGLDYYNVDLQAVLYGISVGFCGCLSTISTFVAEIDVMPNRTAYRYGLVSTLVAQAGIILIYNVYAWSTIPSSVLMPRPVNFCIAQRDLCLEMLNHIDGCESNIGRVQICTDNNDYTTYLGHCSCGSYVLNRPAKLLIDSQLKSNASNAMVYVWPRDAPNGVNSDASCEVIDYCLSYENMCDHLLNRMGCPPALRTISGCDRKGIAYAVSICRCGNWVADLSVTDLIVDVSLQRRYDLLQYHLWPTTDTISFDAAFEDLCEKMLDHLQCPGSFRTRQGNAVRGDYSSWMGLCSCKDILKEGTTVVTNRGVDVSQRVAKNIFDGIVVPTEYALLYRPNPAVAVFEMCRSVYNICALFLDTIPCPLLQRVNTPCGSTSSGTSHYSYGEINITSTETRCRCANLTFLDIRAAEIFQNSIIAEKLYKEYQYIPPAQAAFSLVMRSNPFKQLSQPSMTIPSV